MKSLFLILGCFFVHSAYGVELADLAGNWKSFESDFSFSIKSEDGESYVISYDESPDLLIKEIRGAHFEGYFMMGSWSYSNPYPQKTWILEVDQLNMDTQLYEKAALAVKVSEDGCILRVNKGPFYRNNDYCSNYKNNRKGLAEPLSCDSIAKVIRYTQGFPASDMTYRNSTFSELRKKVMPSIKAHRNDTKHVKSFCRFYSDVGSVAPKVSLNDDTGTYSIKFGCWSSSLRGERTSSRSADYVAELDSSCHLVGIQKHNSVWYNEDIEIINQDD